MGGLFGKPKSIKVDAINQVINQSIVKLTSNTDTKNNISQYIDASGGSTISNNKQYIDVTSNTGSVASAMQKTGFSSDLNAEVKQDLSTQTVALLGALDGLFQNNNIKMSATIENSVNNLNLTELASTCAVDNTITQSIIAKEGSTITGNSQEVKADFIQQCISNSSNAMETMSDLTNSINQKAKSVTENPFNFISDMFKGGMLMVLFIIISIVGGFIVLVGPGNVDANALVRDVVQAAKVATPQGRALTAAQMVTQSTPSPTSSSAPVVTSSPAPAVAPVVASTPTPAPVTTSVSDLSSLL